MPRLDPSPIGWFRTFVALMSTASPLRCGAVACVLERVVEASGPTGVYIKAAAW